MLRSLMRGAITLGLSGAETPPTPKTGIADGVQAGQRAEETGAMHDHPSRRLQAEDPETAMGLSSALDGLETAIGVLPLDDEFREPFLQMRRGILLRLGRVPLRPVPPS
jgi:hypothetical protein